MVYFFGFYGSLTEFTKNLPNFNFSLMDIFVALWYNIDIRYLCMGLMFGCCGMGNYIGAAEMCENILSGICMYSTKFAGENYMS